MASSQNRVLVIDDDIEIQELMEMILSSYDYLVVHAYNGKEGIQILEKAELHELPHLIILDEMMPIMNGAEFISKIKSSGQARLTQIPILLSSGNRSAQTPKLTESRITVVNKPLDLDDLLHKVKTCIANHPSGV